MTAYTIEQFLDLEIQVWDALKCGDAEKDANMLWDNFLGVYDSGFAEKGDHCGQLENGPTIASYKLSNARILVLSADVVLLSYLAELARTSDGKPGEQEQMYVSSVWSRIDGMWLNVFSQDTRATG